MVAHCLQHVSFEGPAYVQEWLLAQGHTLTFTHFFTAGYQLPVVDDIDLLVVMGGPMSVHDEQDYLWLREEKAFIRAVIAAGKKVLGICLGAQLLAECLGGRVSSAVQKEIGWFRVYSEKPVTWLDELLRDTAPVFHWHGEQFSVPPVAAGSVASAANGQQAFVVEERLVGLQFHLEATPVSVEQMLLHGTGDLTGGEFVQTAAALREGLVHVPAGHQLMAKILHRLQS